MKKITEKNLLTLLVTIIIVLFIVLFACKKLGLFSSVLVSGELRDINNNEIVFDTGFSGFLNDYVKIMLESENSQNIKAGLKFDVIDPKGKVVESGILTDGKIFRQSYDAKIGEWKVVLHFKDEDSKAMINFGYCVDDNKENTMRMESNVDSSLPAK